MSAAAVQALPEPLPESSLESSPQSGEAAVDRRIWLAFLAMLVGNFMAILDVQIVASSLNEIQAALGLDYDRISALQTGYLIAEVIAIPLSAYLARALSVRVYFSLCALGFTLASAACAMAWDFTSLLVFRVIQGFMGGGLIPTTMSALFLIFRPGRRRLPYVLIGMVSLLAPAVGAAGGGAITAWLSWHWLFLVNLLPGLAVAALVWRHGHIDAPRHALLAQIDYAGLLGLALMLGALQFVLEEGPVRGWWDSGAIRALALASLAGSLLFAWRARHAAQPIVDLRCLRNRNFVTGCALSFVIGVMLYGVVYLIPTFLGFVRGYDSLRIGQVTMISGITMFLSAPLAGWLQERLDPRWMMAWGLGVVAFGTHLNASLTLHSDGWSFLLPQLIRGHGLTFCLVPMAHLALGTLSVQEVQAGSGLFNLMRNLGGAFGIAWLKTRLTDASAAHAFDLMVAGTPLFDLPRLAAVAAYNEAFAGLAAVVLVTGALLLLARRPLHDPIAGAR